MNDWALFRAVLYCLPQQVQFHKKEMFMENQFYRDCKGKQ